MADRPIYELIKKQRKHGIKLLYENYGKKLYGYGVHTWQLTEDDAWELVYQSLYKLCENIDKYNFANEKAFGSFLFTIFINLVKNHLRDKKEFVHESLDDMAEPANDSSGIEPENSQMVLLREELDKLEDWERVLLLLRSQDMPYTEIAKYTGKTADTLKVYYGRLKEKLSKRIEEKQLKDEMK